MAKLRCKYCKEWVEREEAFRHGLSSFCSKDHWWAFFQERQSSQRSAPKNSPKSEGGVSRVPTQVKRHVARGDGLRCRVCGQRNLLVLHHIIYRSEKANKPWENQPWNLITLCNEPCHLGIVHGNKRRFQPLLLGLTWLREVEGRSDMNVYQFEEYAKVKGLLDDDI